MGKKFIRRQEDFVCENCGKSVVGDGYTNHCPFCLYSKHVDIYPGDRAATCGGLMEPIRFQMRKGEWVLIHRCIRCGHEKVNKMANEDNFDIALQIMQKTNLPLKD